MHASCQRWWFTPVVAMLPPGLNSVVWMVYEFGEGTISQGGNGSQATYRAPSAVPNSTPAQLVAYGVSSPPGVVDIGYVTVTVNPAERSQTQVAKGD